MGRLVPAHPPNVANRIRSFAIEPVRHRPVKAGALAPASRLSALTGRRRLGKRLRLGGNVTFPSTTYAAPLADGVTLGLFAAAGSAVRGHEQKTSFHTLGTKLGPGISLAPSSFFCSVKEGPFLRSDQSHAKHRAQRRSMIAQATVMRRRRRHCFKEENNCKDPRWR